MKRASRVVRALVLATLAGGGTYSTSELAWAAAPTQEKALDAREVRRVCEELRDEGLASQSGSGRSARHFAASPGGAPLPASAPRSYPGSQAGNPGKLPGSLPRVDVSRGMPQENLNPFSPNVEHQRKGRCCCTPSPLLPGSGGELLSVVLEFFRDLLARWLEGRVSPENGACSCSSKPTPPPLDRAPTARPPRPSASDSRSAPPAAASPAPAAPTPTSSLTGGALPAEGTISPPPRADAPRVEGKPHWSRERAIERRKRKAREAADRGEKAFKVSFEDWAAGMARRITPDEIARENAAEDDEQARAVAPPQQSKAEREAAIDARKAADLEARAAAFRAGGGFGAVFEAKVGKTRHG